MNYIKKVCLLKEYSGGFSVQGKTLQGMIKCELNSSYINIELSIPNLAPLSSDKYVLFIGNSSKNVVYEVNSGFCNFNCSTELLDISSFASILLLEKSCKVIMFGKSLECPLSLNEFFKIYKDKTLELFLEDEKIEEEIDKEFKYSDDVVATENYYENTDVDLKNLTLKEEENESDKNENSCPTNTAKTQEQENQNDITQNEQPICSIEKEGLESKEQDCPSLEEFASIVSEPCECDFCINEDVETLLSTYPRFAELENAIYGSKWVEISLEGCEYYFGKMTLESDVYLCYAVKGEDGCCPTELKELASFIPSPYSKNKGFYVMFQKEN